MESNPRGDTTSLTDVPSDSLPEEWRRTLAHRIHSGAKVTDLHEVIERYTEAGITAEQVRQVLIDGGDSLYAAATSRNPTWADQFGGALGVALLAAEVSALTSHLNTRASGVRALAVDALLDDYSAITVASEIGVARQKVYDIAKSGLRGPHIHHVPWRHP